MEQKKQVLWYDYEDGVVARRPQPAIHQPETPHEPIEFLSRSWSASAEQIATAINRNLMQKMPDFKVIDETGETNHGKTKGMKPRGGGIIRLFHHHRERDQETSVKRKDKVRMEEAHLHAVISVAGLAAAMAAAASNEKCRGKMNTAVASAAQLIATHSIELAESAGASRDRLASVVKSAMAIQTASDLLTLTAAAATALRGEAALEARLTGKLQSAPTISPYEKGIFESQSRTAFHGEIGEGDLPCVGDLLQLTKKGVLRWKHASVYLNKACQVTIKVKSKHAGGAFSKNKKCTLYEVIDKSDTWPFRKEGENMELYFGVITSQGLLEFKCKNKVHKQNWVHGIQKLLKRSKQLEEAGNSLRTLYIKTST